MIIRSGRSKIRSAVVMLSTAALAVAGAMTVLAGTRAAGAADGALAFASNVEDEGADCLVPNPGSFSPAPDFQIRS